MAKQPSSPRPLEAAQGPSASPAQASLDAAKEYHRSGRAEQAKQALAQALAADPSHRPSLEFLGRVHMQRQEYDEALAAHRRLADLYPADPACHNALATTLFMLDMLEEAQIHMERALSLRPDSPTYLANLGKMFMTRGEWPSAQYYLEKALDLADNPFQQQLLDSLNMCLENQGLPMRRWSDIKERGAASQTGGVMYTRVEPLAAPPAMSEPLAMPEPQPLAMPEPQPLAMPRPAPAPPQAGRAARLLNILFVQEAPCIRNYKMATALRARGHRVSLAYSTASLGQMYRGLGDEVYDQCIRLEGHRHLWEIAGGYDLVHCHNEPDVLSVSALGGGAPVIHDTHDLISLRAGGDQNLAFFEGLANRAAQGRVYTTAYQRDEAAQLYGVAGPSLVFMNYASRGDLPKRFLPKLSAQDQQIHLVYEGGIGGNAHRDFTSLFVELAQAGLHIHIYPTGHDPRLAEFFAAHATIHYHQPLSPKDILEAMTQYDVGIIPFNLEKGNRRFLDSTIANKLHEYLAAGLPVMASDLKSYRDYFAENPVGFTFRQASDILAGLSGLLAMARATDLTTQARTYEGEVSRLEEFYYQVLEQAHRGQEAPEARPAPASAPAAQAAPADPLLAPLAAPLEQAILALDAWVAGNGWAGWDPYDVKSHLLGQRAQGAISPQMLKDILEREAVDPAGVRAQLGITPQVNAKAMGLFLGSYALLGGLLPGQDFAPRLAQCEEWLMTHAAPGLSGLGWGYPFDWESVVIIPAGTPTSVNSYHVGDAFWELWRASGQAKWLERAAQVAQFLSQDLNQDQVGPESLCFSYTPLDFYHVHNANLCVAEYLVRLGQATDNPEWQDLGRQAVNFALGDLLEQGYLTYWARGFEPSQANVGQMDHYHTAAELRSLARLHRLLPEWAELARGLDTYLETYLARFFEDGRVPKIHPSQTYPVDIHAAAEAAYILGEVAGQSPQARQTLARFIPWFLDNCRNPDGSFIYRLEQVNGQTRRLEIPYMRWGQAWSLRGLTQALAAVRGR